MHSNFGQPCRYSPTKQLCQERAGCGGCNVYHTRDASEKEGVASNASLAIPLRFGCYPFPSEDAEGGNSFTPTPRYYGTALCGTTIAEKAGSISKKSYPIPMYNLAFSFSNHNYLSQCCAADNATIPSNRHGNIPVDAGTISVRTPNGRGFNMFPPATPNYMFRGHAERSVDGSLANVREFTQSEQGE